MRSSIRRREGFALAVAIVAIVVIGALIAGVFFASTQEYRIGRNTLLQTRALTAAELGLNAVTTPAPTGLWSATYSNLAVGATAPPVQLLPGDGSVDTLRVTRLNDVNFFVVSEGRAGSSQAAEARRRVASLVTLQIPQMNVLAALTTRGSTRIGGSSFINGNDTTFAGWGCPLPGAGLPGIAISDSSLITTSGCNNYSCVQGTPKIKEDSAAADTSTYFEYGDTDWQQLTGMANKILSSGPWNGLGPSYNADGSCNVNDVTNWGDPQRLNANTACQDFFPIIYAPGDLKITGGVGQGILLVENDLEVQGGAEFYGPVIVRGKLKTAGTGGHFNGGVMAANVDLDQNTVLGNAVIRYSSCALTKALAGSAAPAFARGRAWVELY